MPQRIGSNQIANTAVIGLKLADNSVRGNNIVAGQIGSNTLSSNLSSKAFSDFKINGLLVSKYTLA